MWCPEASVGAEGGVGIVYESTVCSTCEAVALHGQGFGGSRLYGVGVWGAGRGFDCRGGECCRGGSWSGVTLTLDQLFLKRITRSSGIWTGRNGVEVAIARTGVTRASWLVVNDGVSAQGRLHPSAMNVSTSS